MSKVYCIKTKYNKNDRYGLNESIDYVLFKKGHFYEYDNTSYVNIVVNSDGLRFSFDPVYFVHEEDWREARLNQILPKNGED
jgi:hypothetical protein